MPIRVEIEGQGKVAEFPDGTPQAAIDFAIKRDFFGGKGKEKQKPDKQEDGAVSRFAKGARRGITSLFVGAGQRTGLINQEDADAAIRGMEGERQETGTAGKFGEFVGQTAPLMMIPGGQATLPARLGMNVLSGGLAGGLQPTKAGESATRNALTGAAVGGVVSGAGEGLGSLFKKSPQMARGLYESALKIPPRSINKEARDAIVKTGIEGKYLPSEKGLEKLGNNIDFLNREIKDVISQGTKAGKEVDMNAVVKRIDSLKDFYKDYPRAKKYIDELDKIQQEVIAQNPGKIPLDVAQRMKQRIYQINRKHYGEMKGVDVEADKAIARGLKEELVGQYPELKDLNAKDSALISLEEVLTKSVNRIRNYDIIKMGDSIMSATGAVIGGAPGAALTATGKHILEMPTVKARLAFVLSKANKLAKKTQVKPRTTAALYTAGKIASQPSSNPEPEENNEP